MTTFMDIAQYPIALALPFLGGWLGAKCRDLYWEAHKYRGTWRPR